MRRHMSLAGAIPAALAIFLVVASIPARAQVVTSDTQANITRDWTLRLGLFFWTQSSAANKAGSNPGISALAERAVYKGGAYDILVGIGYNGYNTVYSVPITVTAVVHNANLRYGAALGYAFGKRVDGQGMSGTVLGLLAGYQCTSTLSVDLRYNFISGCDSELDGYALTVGMQL